MAKKSKGNRIVITVECTEARKINKSPSRYTTEKNRHNNTERLEVMKYNPSLRRRTLHKEVK